MHGAAATATSLMLAWVGGWVGGLRSEWDALSKSLTLNNNHLTSSLPVLPYNVNSEAHGKLQTLKYVHLRKSQIGKGYTRKQNT